MPPYNRRRGEKPVYGPIQTQHYLSPYARWKRGRSLGGPDLKRLVSQQVKPLHLCRSETVSTYEHKYRSGRSQSGFWTVTATVRKRCKRLDLRCENDPCDNPSEPTYTTYYLVAQSRLIRSTRSTQHAVGYYANPVDCSPCLGGGCSFQLTGADGYQTISMTNPAGMVAGSVEYRINEGSVEIRFTRPPHVTPEETHPATVFDWQPIYLGPFSMIQYSWQDYVDFTTTFCQPAPIGYQVYGYFTLDSYEVYLRLASEPDQYADFSVVTQVLVPSDSSTPAYCTDLYDPGSGEVCTSTYSYSCDCPDLSRVQLALSESQSPYPSEWDDREWLESGAGFNGFCKHIYASGRVLGDQDLIEPPGDRPPSQGEVENERQRIFESIARDHQRDYQRRLDAFDREIAQANDRVDYRERRRNYRQKQARNRQRAIDRSIQRRERDRMVNERQREIYIQDGNPSAMREFTHHQRESRHKRNRRRR